MKPTIVISIITAVLAVAAGVAIAGLPSTTPGADVVVLEVPTIETRPVPTLPEVTVQPLESTTTEAPATSTTAPTTTQPDAPDDSTPDATTTTTTEPPIDPADELVDRAELTVATANATDVSGVAGAHAILLEAKGYVDVLPVDALQASGTSVVYHQPGLELEAARLAVDLEWDPLALAPMTDLPPLTTERELQLVALVGLDRT